MTKKERAAQAVRVLKERYPDALCSLVYEKPYELMIAARLSAQCTDARVNIVTGPLFRRYPTLEAFAQADLAELETLIRPCGFYRTKAASIKAACERLLNVYGGVIPDHAPRHRPQDSQSAARRCLRKARCCRGYAFYPDHRTPRADKADRTREGRSRAAAAASPGGILGFLPPGGAVRTRCMQRPQAEVQRMSDG